jgi:hypothetical protein
MLLSPAGKSLKRAERREHMWRDKAKRTGGGNGRPCRGCPACSPRPVVAARWEIDGEMLAAIVAEIAARAIYEKEISRELDAQYQYDLYFRTADYTAIDDGHVAIVR